ncbi:YeiH family protein [Vagococcus xieshaowenii]|nr:putative sulfate exporter family transporter [Vagococcus xieshaowenii]
MQKSKKLLPGIILSIMISIVAQLVGRFLPTLGSALIAILLGIIVGNMIGHQEYLDKGTKFSESKLLEIAIALTGLTLSLQSISQIGISGVLYVVLQMSVTILGVILIGKRMGYSLDFRLLMGAGNGVCGSSAIATVVPVISASEKNKGLSITIVNLTGTVLMLIAPILSGYWFHDSIIKSGALIGGNLQSVGQVVASAKMVSDPVTEMATVFKLLRVVLLVVVVLVFSKIKNVSGVEQSSIKRQRINIPWFIMVFFILCVASSTVIHLSDEWVQIVKWLSNQFEIIALAAIGLRVNIHYLLKEGPKAMLYGLTVAVFQMMTAYVLIRLLLP